MGEKIKKGVRLLDSKGFVSYRQQLYLRNISEKIESKPITRKICYILDMKSKKARRRMLKYAPDYMVDYDSLSYWNGDVPREVIVALGKDIIDVSKYLGEKGSISSLYSFKAQNKNYDIKTCIKCLKK